MASLLQRCFRALPRPRSGRDAGSVSLEIAILGPTLLVLIFTIVQAGLWFHARSLALAAAQEGVTAARGFGSDLDAGIARAQSFLDRHAGDSLMHTTVITTGSTPRGMRIEVSGRALSVFPGVPGMRVTQSAQGPIERWTTDGAP
jgi:Flp pilus assembly protein TadG